MFDDTRLQFAIDSVLAGGTLVTPTGSYTITAPLTVTRPLTWQAVGVRITQTTPGQSGLLVRASGVTIQGLTLTGTQYQTGGGTDCGIDATGGSAAAPLTQLVLTDCVLGNWGFCAIRLQYVAGFVVQGCTISNVWYAGVLVLSGLTGVIQANAISNVVGTPNAYGVTLTRNSNTDLAADPVCDGVSVVGNTICCVHNWEGLDSHSGRNLVFRGNVVTGCQVGLTLGAGNTGLPAPKNILVEGNVFDSLITDGSAGYGIALAGASTGLGQVTDYATGIICRNNLIRGHGDQFNGLSGAVYVHDTQGLTLVNNVILRPSPNGVNLYYNNDGFYLCGNLVVDPWSIAHADAVGLKVSSDYQAGTIAGLQTLRGGLVVPYVLSEGIRVVDFPNIRIVLTGNYSDSALPVYDPGHHTS